MDIMKKIFFFALVNICLSSSFSQVYVPTYQINPPSLDIKRIIPKYSGDAMDLDNIVYTDKPYLYSLFVGKKILFYSRNNESTINVNYYDNFSITHFDTLFSEKPDTIWHTIRKHPKPKDYTIIPFVSNKYKPQFIRNKRVSDGNIGKSYIDSLQQYFLFVFLILLSNIIEAF